MLKYFLAARADRMHSDPDFTLFRYLTDGKKADVLWKIPTNIQEVQLSKFIVNHWTLVDILPEVCAIYQRHLTR